LDQILEVASVVEASTPAMTVRDVAQYLNVNEKTVYRLAQCGELPGFKVAGAWRFRPEDIDQWVADQKQSGKSRDDGRAIT
jgi:excisionase family DNA binding protein